MTVKANSSIRRVITTLWCHCTVCRRKNQAACGVGSSLSWLRASIRPRWSW